ncbi:conserved hypothetical protein, secreted [Candidatus Magnetomorum sp. HK-1]|nr:conserved hypothetical protein, secreted [Candidatus Magnetomorum sp. HK-1]
MKCLIYVLFFFLLSGYPNIVLANSTEEESLDDVISGFEDETSTDIDQLIDGFDDDTVQTDIPSKEATNNNSQKSRLIFDYSGHIKLSTTANVSHKRPEIGFTDHRGLSRLRAESSIKFNMNFSNKWKARLSAFTKYDFSYQINGKHEYTKEVLDANESESEFHETYIQGSLTPDLDIWFGRQIVAWGTSESFRIVDVINPIDNREFGMVDIEDLRLPIVLTQLNYYAGSWKISSIFIHENRKFKLPPYGNDYNLTNIPTPPDKIPANNLKNTQFAAAVIGRFSGWDLSFHAAKYRKHFPHFEISPMGKIALNRSILKMLGATLTVAYGNWLVKSEISGTDGHIFVNMSDKKKYSMEGMLGLEYSGFKDTNISFEMMNQHIFKHEYNMLFTPDYIKKNTIQSAFRFTRTFFNEKLSLNTLFILYGLKGQHGTFQRFSLEYDWNDDIDIMFGSVLYQTGKSYIFKKVQDNDRVFFDIQYSF